MNDIFPDLLPEIVSPPPGPQSQAMSGRLSKVESPDVTFSSKDFPVCWERAHGANVWDADGNRYLDLSAAFGVASVGHSHPAVVEAIQKQSARMVHGMGDVHPNALKVELAERLAELAPKGYAWKSVFGLNGSDAIEIAVKTAMVVTGRPGVIAFDDAYHGLGFGALGLTAWDKFHRGFENWLPPHVHRFPFPDGTNANAEAVIDQLRAFLTSAEGKSARIGCAIIEPILGRGGNRPTQPGFLERLGAICDDHDILLITDEIYTGCGRTGTWLATDHENLASDIIVLGKSLGGGMPISVCLARTEIMDQWGVSKGEARHTSTFLGHPLACAAAIEAVKILSSSELMKVTREKGEVFRTLLRAATAECGVKEIRGRGMMIGIELSGEKSGERAWRVVVEGLKRGLILLPCGRGGNVISLTPPLVISERQMSFAAETLGEILKSC